ncbi:MAG: hypothetical protein GWO23_24180 [Gammaproteobacteria bacterium]|nr:hypothetical protein [Gammaproteobacteria bacterium]NIQ75399.1 hypothetical protein [Gammaproteobacteria bacterium]
MAWLISVLLMPVFVHGQTAEKPHRVGLLLSPNSSYWSKDSSSYWSSGDISWRPLQDALQGYGYEQGKNLNFAPKLPRTDIEMSAMAVELISLDLDVIIAADLQAAAALRRATQAIPIVMLAENDPVAAGLVASLALPGGNITGVSILLAEMVGKRLELLKAILPDITKVCMLRDRDNPDQGLWHAAQKAAQILGLTVQLQESRNRAEDLMAIIPQAIAAQCNAIVMLDTFLGNQNRLNTRATESQLPVICDEPAWASHEIRCLLGYGPELNQLMDRLAYQVDRILKGGAPAEIPVEQPKRFKLAINLWVAERLGIEIPPIVIMQTDKIFK